MRVLLAQNMRYLPSHGGANKANRVWLEGLAAAGHECHAVVPLHATEHRLSRAEMRDYLLGRGDVTELADTGAALVLTAAGVHVHMVDDPAGLARYARDLIEATAPDRVLVPSDDPGLLMLGTALRAAPDRVVYIAATLQQIPFGPRTFYPNVPGLGLVRKAACIVAASESAAEYLRRWGGLDSVVLHAPVFGTGPFPRLAAGEPTVTIINPCGFKGLPVLLALADRCPDVRFLAVPTWGTTAEERRQLEAHPRIEVAPPADDVTEILARTRVLLMPSLWDETFGFTAIDAMLHGIPVLASDVGGLREATLGAVELLPVSPITEYRAQTEAEAYPQPVIPPQDVTPWLAALRRLLDDPAHHRAVADRCARAAAGFVAGLDAGRLADVLAKPMAAGDPVIDPAPEGDADALSPQRRAALAVLLARRRTAAPAGTQDASDDDLRRMLEIRHFETALLDLFGRGEIHGTTHTCLGQEYIPVALRTLLRDGDHVFSNHRGHGHYLARFDDPEGLLAEIMGRSGAVCSGVGGSQHILRDRYLSTGVQGESLPVAAGVALHLARREPGALACVHVGDGTFGEGAVYEAMNLAVLWRLPLLIVVEHNGVAQSTPTEAQLAGTIAGRAAAFGMRYAAVDGFEPGAIRAALGTEIERVRAGEGPLLVEFATRRLGPHSKGDDTRPAEEVARLRAEDWHPWYAARLGERFTALEGRARERIAAVVADVTARPPVEPA
ncbi:hypothetical protein GCM10022255_089530 [Dactylosporangium darangshiense]|uniref:Dehydrogenase E1 component domain-containing protein n=1 Tax=Dactylosporangium darangshiense TaxID=579108 RepID=A0ABP8DNR5_9ACTN